MHGSKCFLVLDFALEKYYKVSDVSFQRFEHGMGLWDGKWLQRPLEFFLNDPPHNTRRFGNRPDSDHEAFLEHEMRELIDVSSAAMKHGCHGHIFWCDVQFSKWTSALAEFKDSDD